MSDTSLLPESDSLLPDALNLDASAVDSNLRSIRQVESTWRLPALPDEVRLDLASEPNLGAKHLTGFLYGLERDLFNENDEDLGNDDQLASKPTLSISTPGGALRPIQQSGFEQATNLITSLRNLPPSEVLDADGVQRWKLKAIEKGFLAPPENGVVDGSWSPELSSVMNEMRYADYDSAMRGDRPGAKPLGGENGILKILNDWTSPSGLFRAAVDLDLWWDTGQISKEFSSWGDKWRKVGDSSGPLDFASNLFDALTGPIDDIVIPALNLALVFSGLGVGTNFARLGGIAGGIRSAEAVESANLLYKVPLVDRIFPAIGSGKGLEEASWTAQKLLSSSNGVAQDIGGAMKAWRELKPVIGAKRVIQTGMRLGVLSQAEQRFLPSYKGKSFGDMPGVARTADAVFKPTSGIGQGLQAVAEVALTPYNIFEPGTFVNGGKDVVRGAFKFLGTAPGRAAVGAVAGAGIASIGDADAGDVLEGAAIGAGVGAALPGIGKVLELAPDVPISKMVKGVGRALQFADFKPIAEDQRMTGLFLDAMRSKLDGDELAAFEGRVSSDGFLKAFADHVGVREEDVSQPMAFVAISAAIDHTAAQQAGSNPLAKGFRERYFLARNKLTAQLRVLGEDTTREELIWQTVSKESVSRRGLKARYDDMLRLSQEADPDDTRLAELIANHNSQARLTMRQLLSPENLPIDGLDEVSRTNLDAMFKAPNSVRLQQLQQYIANSLDSFGNWGKYTDVTTGLRDLIEAGSMSEARLQAPMSIFNRKLSMLDHLDEAPLPGIDDDMLANWSKHLHDTLFLEPTQRVEQWRQAGGYYNPFARELDGSRGRFTVMHVNTPSKQEYIEAADDMDQTLNMLDSWLRVSKLKGADGVTPLLKDVQLGGMTQNEVTQTIKALGMKPGKDTVALRRLNRIAQAKGLTVDQAFDQTLRQFADDLSTDTKWAERFGQKLRVQDEQGRVLTGLEALKARSKQLKNDARFRAATIDTEHLVEQTRAAGGDAAADRLAAYLKSVDDSGYKVVYGADFMMPDDLLHSTGLFGDIKQKHMNAMTLGNFFGKRPPAELALNVQRARARAIANELGVAVDDPKVTQAVKDLYAWVLDPALASNAAIMDEFQNANWLRRRGIAFQQADAPRGIQDLALGKQQKNVIDKLSHVGWSDQEAFQIWSGLKKSRYAEFKDLGLYALEAKLRGRSQLLDALHVLGGTPDASVLRRATPGVLVGGAAGMIQAQATQSEGQDSEARKLLGGLVGGAIGGVAGAGIGTGLAKVASGLEKVEHARWARYGYMADNLAAFRDKMRFALSPFFDMSRYTEAFFMTNTGGPKRLESGERIALPMNQSPSSLKRKLAKGFAESDLTREEIRHATDNRYRQIVDEFRQASKGKFDPDDLEDTAKWFQEVGILGYNPTAWMASTFHHLREAGFDGEQAFKHVKEMYTYGTMGRSAAEQSVNFILFPFSFQKKAMKHAAEWLGDDLTRSVLIHDAYKAYEILDQRYDLGQWSQDHLPALEKLQQLNLFAYGLSPGRLGGINAPYLDALVGNPLSQDPKHRGLVFNLFNPIGVDAAGPGAKDVLFDAVKRTIPAINDLQHMIEDAKEQGHVIFDQSHMTRAAETREGYDSWNDFKAGVQQALDEVGAKWSDLYNNPTLAPLRQAYEEKRLELENQYPGWVESKLRAMNKRAELDVEKDHRLNTVLYSPEKATPGDVAFFQMEQQLGNLPGQDSGSIAPGFKQVLAQHGIDSFEDMSPKDYDRVRGVAVAMARQTPSFLMIWKKFYQPTFGPITSEVR